MEKARGERLSELKKSQNIQHYKTVASPTEEIKLRQGIGPACACLCVSGIWILSVSQ